eukprot:scaffold126150_cov60-Attheya_sp.AAC.6
MVASGNQKQLVQIETHPSTHDRMVNGAMVRCYRTQWWLWMYAAFLLLIILAENPLVTAGFAGSKLVVRQRIARVFVSCQCQPEDDDDATSTSTGTLHANPRRREILTILGVGATTLVISTAPSGAIENVSQTMKIQGGGVMKQVTDPDTYSALLYTPPSSSSSSSNEPKKKLPLLVVLHGAGKNDEDIWTELANPRGEHAGLIPSLLASGRAPPELADNFMVVAPYSFGKTSFYEEPRGKLLQFIDWICSQEAQDMDVDRDRIFLFGFSDGATLGVELLTTLRFAGAVVAAYGFTGTLPQLAVERLQTVPIWVFHSADDVIFPVTCSDRLVASLKGSNIQNNVRFTRFDHDQEGFTGSVQGHSTGITASRTPEIYKWMLSLPPKQ